MRNNILITGATGKVGYELVKALQGKGAGIKLATRDLDHLKQRDMLQYGEPRYFNFDDPKSIAAALYDIDRLYLVTPGFNPRELDYGKQVVDIAKRSGVKHVVKLSAMGVENMPEMPHRQLELYIEQSGLKWTHLRPTFFDQNFSTMQAESIKAGGLYVAAADGKTSFIDTRDIGAVAAKVLTTDTYYGKALTLTGPEALTYGQVAEYIAQALGKAVKYTAVSDADARKAMASQGMPEVGVNAMSGLFGAVREGYCATVTSDVEQVLGRKPTPFVSFVKDSVGAWR